MSDDRFAPPEERAPEPQHVIRMLAAVPLVYADGHWVIEEDPTAILDADYDLVCSNEGHLDSKLARDRCDIEKERARGQRLPTAREVADAFARAADAGWQLDRARSN